MLVFATVFWVLLGGVTAGNVRIEGQKSRLDTRQLDPGPYNGPSTVQTVQMLNTDSGPAVEMCNIQLTAMTDASGDNLVREDRNCTTTYMPATSSNEGVSSAAPNSQLDPNSDGANVGTISLNSTTTGDPEPVVVTPSTDSNDAAPAGSGSSTNSTTTSASVTASVEDASSTAAISSATVAAVSVIGTTLVSESAAPAGSNAASTTSAASDVLPTTQTTAVTSSVLPTIVPANNALGPSSSSSAIISATAAADEAASTSSTPSAAAAIQLPGTKMQVLPIGLGVFGGITAIALLVIGYVMWERTKYRKNFRQRKKLADQAVAVGYGGMAERV